MSFPTPNHPSQTHSSIWTKLPTKTEPRSRFPSVDVLAQEVSRSPKRHPRHALFLGAGASATSGIPTAGTLVEQWRQEFFRDRCQWAQHNNDQAFREAYAKWFFNGEYSQYERDAREWEQYYGHHPSEYAFLFSFVASRPFARQEKVERLVEGKEPGPGYVYLASLVLEGRFRTMLTTNFDDLIHDALYRYAGVKPAVCAFDSQISSIHPNTARPIIVKLHGDFMYNNLRNVGSEVQRLSQNMREKLYQTCKGNGLVVLGYGGADESVMTPLAGMLHDGTFLEDGLHWCLHCKKDATSLTIPGEVWRLYESHSDMVKIYWTDGFDDAMEKMYAACGCDPPPALAKPREHSLCQRLEDALEAAEERYRVSGKFNELLNEFRAKDRDERPWYALELSEAEHAFALAKAFQKEGRYDQGDVELQKSIECCNSVLRRHLGEEVALLRGEQPPAAVAVAAFRRRSGALGQRAELLLVRCGMKCRETENLNGDFTLQQTIASLGNDALESSRSGLSLLKRFPEAQKHELALTYNGLTGLGYLRVSSNAALTAELMAEFIRLRAELVRLDQSGRDIRELREDCHGYWLIERDLETQQSSDAMHVVPKPRRRSRNA